MQTKGGGVAKQNEFRYSGGCGPYFNSYIRNSERYSGALYITEFPHFALPLSVTLDGKTIPVQARTGPLGSSRLRIPEFLHNRRTKTVRISAPRSGRLYTTRRYSWYSFLLRVESTPGPKCGRKDYVREQYQRPHRKSNPRPSGLWRSASTNCAKTRTPCACVRHSVYRFPPDQYLRSLQNIKIAGWFRQACTGF